EGAQALAPTSVRRGVAVDEDELARVRRKRRHHHHALPEPPIAGALGRHVLRHVAGRARCLPRDIRGAIAVVAALANVAVGSRVTARYEARARDRQVLRGVVARGLPPQADAGGTVRFAPLELEVVSLVLVEPARRVARTVRILPNQ